MLELGLIASLPVHAGSNVIVPRMPTVPPYKPQPLPTLTGCQYMPGNSIKQINARMGPNDNVLVQKLIGPDNEYLFNCY